MSKQTLNLVVAASLIIALVSGTAWVIAASGSGRGDGNEVIHACINPAGQLRIVGPDEQCHSNETELAWNVLSPQVTEEQLEILSHMSIVFLDDGMGNTIKTIRITGVNVQVVNGMDDTETTNGAGNLIIGYNEDAPEVVENRSGSHNLVVGIDHTFNSYGGFIAGFGNNITAPYASVSGGRDNSASGSYASVSGGKDNRANGLGSSVSGGRDNTASSNQATVSGGFDNTASGLQSSVSGGAGNTASGPHSSVSGGAVNTAIGGSSSVSGGGDNEASGPQSSVSGGFNNTASGFLSSVSGGRQCTVNVNGFYASVSGGLNRSVSGEDDWAAGSLFEDD